MQTCIINVTSSREGALFLSPPYINPPFPISPHLVLWRLLKHSSFFFLFFGSVLPYPFFSFRPPTSCSVCVMLISDRHCSVPSVEPKQQRWILRRKHIGKHHSPDTKLFFPLFIDVFNLILLTSYLPLTIFFLISHYLSHHASLLIFFLHSGWQLQKLGRTRRKVNTRVLLHWRVHPGWLSEMWGVFSAVVLI